MAPVYDLFNHRNPKNSEFKKDSPICFCKQMNPSFVCSKRPLPHSLIPRSLVVAARLVVDEADGFKVFAGGSARLAPPAVGDELFNSYGEFTPNLFRDYGFVEPPPQHWYIDDVRVKAPPPSHATGQSGEGRDGDAPATGATGATGGRGREGPFKGNAWIDEKSRLRVGTRVLGVCGWCQGKVWTCANKPFCLLLIELPAEVRNGKKMKKWNFF